MRRLLILLITFMVWCIQTKAQHRAFRVPDSLLSPQYIAIFKNDFGDTLLQLDTSKYYYCATDTMYGYVIVGMNSRPGWWAINQNHKPLFEVYNLSYGDITPDKINEGYIRIIDKNLSIGFADSWGKVVIEPQFPIVTPFKNGYAIFGDGCEPVMIRHADEPNCKHFTFKCDAYGIVDNLGKIRATKILTYEEAEKKIEQKEFNK